MTYNRKEIMTEAWTRYRNAEMMLSWSDTNVLHGFGFYLKAAWDAAKAHKPAPVVTLADRREALKAEITRLEYSDTLGTATKLSAARNELRALAA